MEIAEKRYFHSKTGHGWTACKPNGNHEVIEDLVSIGEIPPSNATLFDVPDGSGDYKVEYVGRHVICSYEEPETLKSDIRVIMGSHTRNYNGTHTEIVKAGSVIHMEEARDGTKWVLFCRGAISDKGYRTFCKRGKLTY